MTQRTQHNLDLGMHAEAFASAKYRRFAAFARSRENCSLAELMSKAADESRIDNFANEMKLAGLPSDDMFNLADVIRNKLNDSEQYGRFAKDAEQDGDDNAAEFFKRLSREDARHASELAIVFARYQDSKPGDSPRSRFAAAAPTTPRSS